MKSEDAILVEYPDIKMVVGDATYGSAINLSVSLIMRLGRAILGTQS